MTEELRRDICAAAIRGTVQGTRDAYIAHIELLWEPYWCRRRAIEERGCR